jgi:hypothetical protein
VFLVMPLKHVLSVMDLVNHSRTPKQWAIAHENGPKMQKRWVFGHASQKHVLSFMGFVNHSRTPKLWAIAHEKGPKTQKRCVFGHASQTCTKCHGPCKSLRNPKTLGNSSWKRPKNAKPTSFWSRLSKTYWVSWTL